MPPPATDDEEAFNWLAPRGVPYVMSAGGFQVIVWLAGVMLKVPFAYVIV